MFSLGLGLLAWIMPLLGILISRPRLIIPCEQHMKNEVSRDTWKHSLAYRFPFCEWECVDTTCLDCEAHNVPPAIIHLVVTSGIVIAEGNGIVQYNYWVTGAFYGVLFFLLCQWLGTRLLGLFMGWTTRG